MIVEKIKKAPRIYSDGKANIKKLRVAAYCRVSTDSEDQMNSYNSQKQYYTDLISKNENYEMVGIYADPGITGTSVAKREEFQRLISDAKEGKIDLIMTKSISRFARNTLDTLKYVRMLKEVNVAVKFEEENINTVSMDGELLLTILSSVAQQEVQNISANVKKGLDMKMQRGQMIGFNGCLGYDYIQGEKKLVVNPEEAKIVKYIFNRYAEGYGGRVIARELTELGYKTKSGSTRWSDGAVIDIIKNEKYKGDLVLGKSYTVDPISKRRVRNFGEQDMYYIKDHHEAIIDRDTFDLVQEINKKKHNCFKPKNVTNETREIYHRKYAFTGMAYCAYCGSRLFRRTIGAARSVKIVWHCTNHIRNGSSSCPDSRQTEEKVIEDAFVEAFNMLAKSKAGDIDEFLKDVGEGLNGKDYAKELNDIQQKIKKLEKKKENLFDMRADDIITKEELNEKLLPVNQQIDDLRKEESTLTHLDNTKNSFTDKAIEFKKILSESELLSSFDRTIFESAVERVIIGNDNDPNGVTIVFKHEYTEGEKKFNNKNTSNQLLNCNTHFCVMNDAESKEALDYIYSNIVELFSFNLKKEHYVFLPNKEKHKIDKILKHYIPVKVMMTTN